MYVHIHVRWYMPTNERTYVRTYVRTYHNVCTYVPYHSYVHTYVRTYVRTHARTYVRTYIRTYLRTYLRTYIRTCVRTYARTYVRYVGTFHTHGVLEKYFGRTPDLFLRVLDLHTRISLSKFSSKSELFQGTFDHVKVGFFMLNDELEYSSGNSNIQVETQISSVFNKKAIFMECTSLKV